MTRFGFRKGLTFLEGSRAWSIVRRLVTGKIQLEDIHGELKTLEMSELQEKWAKGQWVIDEESLGASANVFYLATPRDLSTFSETHQIEARRKQAYLTKLGEAFAAERKALVFSPQRLNQKIAEIARELHDDNPPSSIAIYRWHRKFSHTKCITKLVDGRSRSGRRRNETIFSVFQEALAEVFLTPQKVPGKAVFDALTLKIRRLNQSVGQDEILEVPGRATVYRWLNDLHRALVMRAREGKAYSERALRAAIDSVKVSKILERIELDHTPVDLLVIDLVTKLILGRPWLTLAIDRYSRCVVGFYLSFHAPSAYSVLYCMRQAIMPKDGLLAQFPDIRNKWLCYGIPEMVAVDNGMDLHADAVEAAFADIGIEILYCGAGQPEMKGAIERLNRTISADLFHQLPGTTFSNPKQRADYASEQHAAIDLKTLVHLVTKWIVDVYHQTPHRGLGGRTPHEVWLEGESQRVIELPAYPQQLDVIIGNAATRTLFHYGVEVDSLRYNSPLLQTIRARDWSPQDDNLQVALRCYETDISYINVFDPKTKEYIQVPAVDREYTAGLHRQVHRMIRQEVCRRFGDDWHHDQLLAVKAEIQAIVEAATRDKKTSNRKKAAVAFAYDSEQILTGREELIPRHRTPIDTSDKVLEDFDPALEDDLPDFGAVVRQREEVGHGCV